MPIRKDYASCAAPKKTESAGHAALLAALGGLPPGRARVALALACDVAHSRRWHRKQAHRRFYARFGRWPGE